MSSKYKLEVTFRIECLETDQEKSTRVVEELDFDKGVRWKPLGNAIRLAFLSVIKTAALGAVVGWGFNDEELRARIRAMTPLESERYARLSRAEENPFE